jgi:hypothetical protein
MDYAPVMNMPNCRVVSKWVLLNLRGSDSLPVGLPQSVLLCDPPGRQLLGLVRA